MVRSLSARNSSAVELKSLKKESKAALVGARTVSLSLLLSKMGSSSGTASSAATSVEKSAAFLAVSSRFCSLPGRMQSSLPML